jgi:hypothetical protein
MDETPPPGIAKENSVTATSRFLQTTMLCCLERGGAGGGSLLGNLSFSAVAR